MSVDQIKEVIDGVLKELGIENPTPKDKGAIMKGTDAKGKGKSRWQGCQRNSGCYAEVIAE